jgi:hypothetical protein
MTHPETNEFYIGRRKSKIKPELDIYYTGSSSTWYRELDAYTISNVLIKEILLSDIKTFDELCKYEIEIITENIKNPLCRNAHIPGKGFYINTPRSDETKNRISKSNIGKHNIKHTEESKNKMSNSLKGKVHSDDHNKKVSISNTGKILPPEVREKISNSLKGRILSDEHKEKISKFQKGKILSEEHKEKISSSSKGKKMSEEAKNNMSKSRIGKKLSDEQKEKMKNSQKERRLRELVIKQTNFEKIK